MLKDPAAWKALFCIRCGACLNACPVFRRAGGWAYGWVYPGPIGSILTPHLIGLQKAGKLPFASSLCGACGEVCPVKIDIPHQLVHLRHRAVNEPSPMNSASERLMWAAWAWAMGGPIRYKLTMFAVRLGVRFVPSLPGIPASLGLGPAAASCRSPTARRFAVGGNGGKGERRGSAPMDHNPYESPPSAGGPPKTCAARWLVRSGVTCLLAAALCMAASFLMTLWGMLVDFDAIVRSLPPPAPSEVARYISYSMIVFSPALPLGLVGILLLVSRLVIRRPVPEKEKEIEASAHEQP